MARGASRLTRYSINITHVSLVSLSAWVVQSAQKQLLPNVAPVNLSLELNISANHYWVGMTKAFCPLPNISLVPLQEMAWLGFGHGRMLGKK